MPRKTTKDATKDVATTTPSAEPAEIKAELLAHYATHEPNNFIACDGIARHSRDVPWHRCEWSEDESPWRRVCELMRGDLDVRVLINPRLSLRDAVNLLYHMVKRLEGNIDAEQDRAVWESALCPPFNDHYPSDPDPDPDPNHHLPL